jgi:hypothetical protein
VFEKRGLRRMFEPKRDEVMGSFRRLYNDNHSLYSPGSIVRVMQIREAGIGCSCSMHGR